MERHIMRKLFMIAAAFIGLAAFSSAAEAKTARCVLNGFMDQPYDGPCDFKPLKGGSFSVVGIRDDWFDKSGYQVVRLTVTVNGRGRLEGRAGSAMYVDIATVARDRNAPACWAGDDYRICVY